jgi:hypothetical protein
MEPNYEHVGRNSERSERIAPISTMAEYASLRAAIPPYELRTAPLFQLKTTML